jgi:hypothetical protein
MPKFRAALTPIAPECAIRIRGSASAAFATTDAVLSVDPLTTTMTSQLPNVWRLTESKDR